MWGRCMRPDLAWYVVDCENSDCHVAVGTNADGLQEAIPNDALVLDIHGRLKRMEEKPSVYEWSELNDRVASLRCYFGPRQTLSASA